MRRLALVVLLALGVSGCPGYRVRSSMPTLVFRMHGGASEESFAELTALARELGYHVDFVDARYGVFGVHTVAPLAQGVGPATIVVQCFDDGQATITVLGGIGLPHTDLTRVSDRVRREVVAFAQAMDAGHAP